MALRTKLEAAGNILVILIALAVGAVVLTRYANSSRTPRSVAAGDHLASIPGLDWARHHRTLLLVLNTGCHFCQDSVPFYQKLAQVPRLDSDAVQIVAVFPNEVEMVRQFAAQEGLTIRSLPGVPLENWRVNVTPTLILVNREGQVEKVWIGVLTAKEQMDLLKLAEGT